MMGGILGVLAMIFSIIGIVMAIKNNTPKWIGVTGVLLCILSIFSFFVPFMCAGMIKNKTAKIEVAESVSSGSMRSAKDVTIQINSVGSVRCINNANTSNTVIGNMSTYDFHFDNQLTNWLKMNKVNSSTNINVIASKDAEYSDITKVLDALRENGITKFRLSNNQ